MTLPNDPTPPRTPSSIQRIALWGIVEAWLAQSPQRGIILTSGAKGLRMTVIDPDQGEVFEDVGLIEDPSRVALRAIERLRAGMGTR